MTSCFIQASFVVPPSVLNRAARNRGSSASGVLPYLRVSACICGSQIGHAEPQSRGVTRLSPARPLAAIGQDKYHEDREGHEESKGPNAFLRRRRPAPATTRATTGSSRRPEAQERCLRLQ